MPRIQPVNPRLLNVLVAEDEAFQRIAISDILDLCGFNVTVCENGLSARDELLKTDTDFDVILLDLMMPEMNGIELLKIIKTIERLKDIPVFIMSQEDENEIVATCLGLGAKDYIVKPVGYKLLKKMKEDVLSLQLPLPKKHDNNEKVFYSHVRNLGRGAAGSVELVRRSTDNELFAMKVIPMHFLNEVERKNAENEVHLLRLLVGPTIIRYYESFIEGDSINIIMEHAEGGSLDDTIQDQKKTSKPFQKDQILYWTAQMVIAILFMHQRNVLHRDIKTQNMFLKKNIIKLGDFGISKSLGVDDMARTYIGTPYFMPPEVFKNEPYGTKADIWSLGCAIYELVALKRPFQHDVMVNLKDLIMNQPYQELDPSVGKDLSSLLDRMLQKDPNKRPSIWELAKIPCIEEKIQLFYKEHPEESDPQNEIKIPTLLEETTKNSNVENLEEIIFILREKIKFSKHFKGTFRYKTYSVISGIELFEALKIYKTIQKTDDQIRDSLKQMFESKLIQLIEGGNPSSQEFQSTPNAWYSFSVDLANIPANLTKTYLGQSGDALELVLESLQEGKRIQGDILKIQVFDQTNLKALTNDYLYFKSLSQRLQNALLNDQDKDKLQSIFLNLYQLMKIHKQLRGLFNDAYQIQFNQKGPGLLTKLFSTLLPFIAGELACEEFSYQFLGHQFTIDDIKHGVLRGNQKQKDSSFRPWKAANQKFHHVLKLDPKVIFLFHEDCVQNNKTKIQTNQEKLNWTIHLFKQATVESKLEEIVKKWISLNVCLDVVENDIHIHPLMQAYNSDFGNDNVSLLQWIFKYMNANIDQDSIIKDLKENKFYVTFKDPNDQS